MTSVQIDLTTWPRRDTYALFQSCQKPHFGVTSRIDVTRILGRRKADKTFSSYLACAHAIGAGLHAVPELATRIRGDKIVQHDRLNLSTTLQFPDGRLGFTYMPWLPNPDDFAQSARKIIDEALAQGELVEGLSNPEADGVAFLSCQPWIDFTAMDSPVKDANDSIPRIAWGRYTPLNDRTTIALSCQAHHGLADGYHIAQFFLAAQAAADRF